MAQKSTSSYVLGIVSLLYVIALVLWGAPTAHAATLYINSATGNDTTGDGTSGSPYRSFHKAYTSATSGDTVDATGTFTWTDSAETGDSSTSGYTLSKNLIIAGHGPDQTTFQASSTDNTADRRVFTLSSTYTLSLQDLTIRYGKITSGNGGCVLSSGDLTITRVEMYSCRSTNGNGGGISSAAGAVTMTNSAVYSNVTYYGGGGVHLGQSSAATSTLTNNTIYSNNVTSSGGAFYGGGVFASGLGNVYLTNNTIAANNSGGSYGIGGGLLIYNSSMHLYMANNFIASNTAAYYAGTSDFHTYGGTIHNYGHNIIGRAESYSWVGYRDWTDSNGDSVFVLNGSTTTGRLLRDSAAAVNSSPYKTKTWAVLTGSIAINNGTTTANGLVSIPSTDQRGAARVGATDIGSYEYDGAVSDTTGPVISSVASSTTATTATITWTTDEGATSTVNYGTSVSYGTASSSASSVTSHTYNLSGLSAGTTYHFQIVVTDAASNTTTSSDYTFTTATPDVTAPTLSSIASSTTTSTATITWTTNENASSTVRYGATSSYGSASTTPAYQTSQSITITGLTAATTYHFRVESSDSSGNLATSSDYTFTTSAVPDTTAPVISSIASTTTDTTATVTWTTNENASSTVRYGATSSYGSASTTPTYQTSQSITLTSLSPATTYHFRVESSDSSGNLATSSDYTLTTSAAVGSTPTGVTFTPTATGGTATWTTAIAASSRLAVGLTSTFSSTTPERDISPRVTSHSVSITGLPSCTRFYYAVYGATASGGVATSSTSTFVTEGCTGSATVSATGDNTITTAAGGSLTEDALSLTVPSGFTGTSSAATFQAHRLDAVAFFASAGAPTGKSRVGETVYALKALIDATTTLSAFSAPITVSLSYSAGDVNAVEESSLWIYRYDGTQWHALTACVVDTVQRTVTCETSGFSDFSLFGTARANTASARRAGGGFTLEARIKFLREHGDASLIPQLVAQYSGASTTVSATIVRTVGTISATLRPRMTHAEVTVLQTYLNTHGYTVATSGPGSPGKETTYFGIKTELALKRFQEANAARVLIPAGLHQATGIVGPFTRALINGG